MANNNLDERQVLTRTRFANNSTTPGFIAIFFQREQAHQKYESQLKILVEIWERVKICGFNSTVEWGEFPPDISELGPFQGNPILIIR